MQLVDLSTVMMTAWLNPFTWLVLVLVLIPTILSWLGEIYFDYKNWQGALISLAEISLICIGMWLFFMQFFAYSYATTLEDALKHGTYFIWGTIMVIFPLFSVVSQRIIYGY